MNSSSSVTTATIAQPTTSGGRSKTKLSTQMKEHYDNITEKMEGGILVRRYKGKKIEIS
jgi:hypothetical protein